MQLRAHTGLLSAIREIVPANATTESSGKRLLPLAWLAAAGVFAILLVRSGGTFLHALERALHGGWPLVALGAAFEAVSLIGYVLLQHHVFGGASRRLRLKDSYDIALAGTAATRFLPTAGLGGAAVTVWALRARGMRAGDITERLLAFLLMLYGVYMSALFLFGAAIGLGIVPVASGRALGIVGAALAVAVSAAVLALLAAPALSTRLIRGAARRSARLAPALARAEEQVPAVRDALARAGRELRRPQPALLGAVAWWAFDIGVLVAMLRAFGVGLPIPVVVLAYFLGTMFNLLPLPGGLSGGLAGTMIALGAPAGGALAAVMAYRAVAVWLPAASGITSLIALRRTVTGWRSESEPLSSASEIDTPYSLLDARPPRLQRQVEPAGERAVLAAA
jgi:uncharacterized membrane protein YbhN (UPF0104 family)